MAVLKNKAYHKLKGISQAIKDLGVDLKLTAEGDLEVNNLSDISIIHGMENLAQATAIKVTTETQGNRYHPAIGVNLPIGEKTVDAMTVKFEILKSLRQDPRFDNIEVDVYVEGNTYIINATVTVVNTDITIPLQFVAINS